MLTFFKKLTNIYIYVILVKMKKLTTEEFVYRAKNTHGNKYDYSKVEYKNRRTKVCIICPKHGEFLQAPDLHINGQNCPKCAKEYIDSLQKKKAENSSKTFEEKSKKIHGNKYDYSKVHYVNALSKVELVCPTHGSFFMRPNDHLNGYGCPKCGFERVSNIKKDDTEKWIKKAKIKHGDKYDYSKVEYIDSKTKICIICHKHGEFWQTPAHHLRGQGCPKCSESSLEKQVRIMLTKNKVSFNQAKKFDWLGKQHLDFYLPEYNIAIECQGIQHFKPIDFANKGKKWANELFENNKKRDKLKKRLCKIHGVKLIYFNYNDKIIKLKNKIL